MGTHKVKIPLTNEEYKFLDDLQKQYAQLLDGMTVDERRAWFEKFICKRPLNFKKKIGNTIYSVTTHFNESAKESIEQKMIRIMENDEIN